MLSLYASMIKLKINIWYAFITSALFFCGPVCIQYESINFYSYTVVSLLCVILYYGIVFAEKRTIKRGIIFFSLCAMLVLTRNLFHLVWIVCIIVGMIWLYKSNKKIVLISAVIPFLIASSVYIKNYFEFGSFSSSTWVSIGMAKMTTFSLPDSIRIKMINTGEISKYALLSPLMGLCRYQQIGLLPKNILYTGVPVLDETNFDDKSNNFNNLLFLKINKYYQKDAIIVLLKYPSVYLGALARSVRCFFLPAGEWSWFVGGVESGADKNREILKWWDNFYKVIFSGQIPMEVPNSGIKYQHYATSTRAMGWFGLFVFIVAIGSGTLVIIKHKKGIVYFTVIFTLGTIIYVFLLSTFLEVGENMRYRFDIEPYLFVMIGLLFTNKKEMLSMRGNFKCGK